VVVVLVQLAELSRSIKSEVLVEMEKQAPSPGRLCSMPVEVVARIAMELGLRVDRASEGTVEAPPHQQTEQ
jgi:hypothetical protein